MKPSVVIFLVLALVVDCTFAFDECAASDTFPCSHEVLGNLILMVLYGIILAYGMSSASVTCELFSKKEGAKLISDGSELLLRVCSPGVIGGFVLPVLGAVPDAAIIVVSGALGTAKEAQEQLSVGVGTLAGSTIMLLTIPYAASLFLARCDIVEGVAKDRTLSNKSKFDWKGTGVTVDGDVAMNAKIAMGTSFAYFIIQGVAFHYLSNPSDSAAKNAEKGFALAAFIICLCCFVGYSVFQVLNSQWQEKRIKQAKEDAEKELRLAKMKHLILYAFTPSEKSSLLPTSGDAEQGRESTRPNMKYFAGKWKDKALNKSPGDEVATENVELEEEEEEEEEMTPAQVWSKSLLLMGIGLALVTIFSDPMVGAISHFGHYIHVGSFYVSFIVTPFCSNASELISSLIFASRKKRSNTTITFSQLFGAACMNNTLCLGIFVALVYFRDLAWTFSAETLAIFVSTIAVGLMSLKQTLQLWTTIPVICVYPLSLALVAILENTVNWK